jgi:hypothetical protein
LQYAIDAGIDYFIYCWYDPEKYDLGFTPLYGEVESEVYTISYTRKLHLKSNLRKKIKLCGILMAYSPVNDKTVNDLIDVALQFDFIKRVNNVTYELVNLSTGEVITDSETGETLRGKKSYLIDYLHTHDTFREKYLAMIKEFISASNDKSVLDKESLKAIEAEEDAIERPQEDEAKRKVLLEGE